LGYAKIYITMKKLLIFLLLLTAVFVVFKVWANNESSLRKEAETIVENLSRESGLTKLDESINPLSIQRLKDTEFEGSEISIEQTLEPGSNYERYLTSYTSEGNKIFALLTVPHGPRPQTGFPVVVFNHGYIPPNEYRTTERYIAYTDAFSRNGYIVFKSDYRGHGESEGEARGGYGSNDYTIDVLNAVASIKKYEDADPNRIGMWGHSMGGYITLRTMVVKKDVKAGVIWAGVVASYPDLLTRWRRNRPSLPPTGGLSRGWRNLLIETYGDPSSNPEFWNSISANSYLADISGPIQLHHGTADSSVPVEFSEKLEKQLQKEGKTVELYVYEGDDHNLSANLGVGLQRSLEFFDKHLK
jgi:uncharacterized protein